MGIIRAKGIGDLFAVGFNPYDKKTYVMAQSNQFPYLVDLDAIMGWDYQTPIDKYGFDLGNLKSNIVSRGVAMKDVSFHIAKLLPPTNPLPVYRYKTLDMTEENINRLKKHINGYKPKDFDTRYVILSAGTRVVANDFHNVNPKSKVAKFVSRHIENGRFVGVYPNLYKKYRANLKSHSLGSRISTLDMLPYIPKNNIAGVNYDGLLTEYVFNESNIKSLKDVEYITH